MIHIVLKRETTLESAIDWCITRDINYKVTNNWPADNAIFSLNTSDDVTITAFMLQFHNNDTKTWHSS